MGTVSKWQPASHIHQLERSCMASSLNTSQALLLLHTSNTHQQQTPVCVSFLHELDTNAGWSGRYWLFLWGTARTHRLEGGSHTGFYGVWKIVHCASRDAEGMEESILCHPPLLIFRTFMTFTAARNSCGTTKVTGVWNKPTTYLLFHLKDIAQSRFWQSQ